MLRRPLVALALANVVYAAAFPVSQLALDELGPFTVTGLRFLIAASTVAPLGLPLIRRLDRAEVVRLGAIATLGLWMQMVLIYYGIDAANAAIAAVIVGLEPVLIALWAAVLLGETFGSRKAGGLAIGLAGSLLVAGVGASGGAAPSSVLLLLGTGLTFSWYTVQSKPYLRRFRPLQLISIVSVLGAAVALAPMAVEVVAADGWRSPGPATCAAVLYLGIGNSVLGYALWNRALHGLPAAAVGASLYAQPVLGAGLSWLAFRDPLPATFVPGAALVLAGVWLATRR
jgi:drug/metabolite transporter (DMT)-like permease